MTAQIDDRAAGAVLGMAVGDALGAGYEFGPPLPDDAEVTMKGGGGFGWAPGEWTDDTSMAIPILQAAAAGEPLTHDSTQDRLVAAWADWARTAPDVGVQTRAVLSSLTARTTIAARAAAKAVHDRSGRSGGNGSLMRTAPVALRHLDDPGALMRAAGRISGLTHHDSEAAEACVIWSLAIRHAVLHGEFAIREAVAQLPEEDRRQVWLDRIDEAERKRPRDFAKNGWVVQAFQAAWSAIATTPVPADVPARHLRLAFEAAVRGGNDTDTVAAIAGGLLGARWGSSAVPAEWRRILHGWPGLDARALSRLAILTVHGGPGDGTGWPATDRVRPFGRRTLVPHPHDDGVLLGSLGALDDLPSDVDAVVSLCRTGRTQTDREQVDFWLIDQDGKNPNLDFVLRDAADTVAALRAEGKRVLLHCAEGRSRTPSVGALYSALQLGVPVDRALAEVTAALPDSAPQRFLQDAVRRIAAESISSAEPEALDRPEITLLRAVQLLHERGYQRLWINPTFYATGHWRCSLRSGRAPDEVVHLQYTNGRWWDVLGDGRSDPRTPEQLADDLEAALPRLERARGANAAYAFWYSALLEQCGSDRVPWLSDEYTSPEQEGRMALTRRRGPGLLSDSFPLPPA